MLGSILNFSKFKDTYLEYSARRIRADKTGYPAHNGPAHDGLGLLRVGPKRPRRLTGSKIFAQALPFAGYGLSGQPGYLNILIKKLHYKVPINAKISKLISVRK